MSDANCGVGKLREDHRLPPPLPGVSPRSLTSRVLHLAQGLGQGQLSLRRPKISKYIPTQFHSRRGGAGGEPRKKFPSISLNVNLLFRVLAGD